MKKRLSIVPVLGLSLLLVTAGWSETTSVPSGETIPAPAEATPADPNPSLFLYTVAYNSIPGGSSIPLIGFVNSARGTHNGLEFGFVNTASSNFRGVQFGFINTVFGSVKGVQFGYVNTTTESLSGVQFGFVNTTLSQVNGVQFGFVNTATESLDGVQFGFVNTALHPVSGVQFGYVNTATEGLRGMQFGFINSTRELSGLQFGFVNIADTVADGLPIGLISIVSKGGYRAVEVSADEWHPFNLTGKMGLPRFYTLLRIGTDNPTEWKRSETNYGLGFGSLWNWSDRISFNPELVSLRSLSFDDNEQRALSLTLQLRYHLCSQLWIGGGASLFVVKTEDGDTPSFSRYGTLAERKFNNDRRGGIGLRAAVGWDWGTRR